MAPCCMLLIMATKILSNGILNLFDFSECVQPTCSQTLRCMFLLQVGCRGYHRHRRVLFSTTEQPDAHGIVWDLKWTADYCRVCSQTIIAWFALYFFTCCGWIILQLAPPCFEVCMHSFVMHYLYGPGAATRGCLGAHCGQPLSAIDAMEPTNCFCGGRLLLSGWRQRQPGRLHPSLPTTDPHCRRHIWQYKSTGRCSVDGNGQRSQTYWKCQCWRRGEFAGAGRSLYGFVWSILRSRSVALVPEFE